MSFKEELLKTLSELEVTPESVAKGLKEAFLGETVTEEWKGQELVKRTVSRNPQDILRGAMLYDALRGGDLGLAPASMKKGIGADTVEVVHKRLAVDDRVIAYEDKDGS